jgi:hypothetical protein
MYHQRVLIAVLLAAALLFMVIDPSRPVQAGIDSPLSNVDAAQVVTDTQQTQPSPDDNLFVDVSAARLPQLPVSPAIRRQRYIQVRFEQLGYLQPAKTYTESIATVSRQVKLNLFNDVAVIALLDRVVLNESGGYSWIGHLEGIALSQVILTVRGDQMFGSINYPGGVFEIKQVDKQIHIIDEVNQSDLPEDRPAVADSNTPSDPEMLAGPQTDDGSVIDVLVVYTDDARAAAGGQAQIETLIDTAINDTNASYANSGINQQIRLVATAEVNYNETGNATTDKTNLRNGTANLQIARDLRDAYGADLVTMIVETNNQNLCGEAYNVMGTVSSDFAPDAYDVVVRNLCAVSNHSFAHELGHLMGARHDWFVDATNNSPYSFNHGYVLTPTLPNPWRTIMAYDNRCQAAGTTCTRIAFWSNPAIMSDSNPVGVPAGTSTSCTISNTLNPQCDADNHQALNNTAYTVANFRPGNLTNVHINPSCTLVGGVCVEDGTSAFPYDTIVEGVYRAAPNTTVWINAGNYPEMLVLVNKTPRGLVINRSVTLEVNGSGTVTVGQ